MSGESLSALAKQLIAGCRENNLRACLDSLYAPGAVSHEAVAGPGREAVGLDAIRARHDWWADRA